MGEPGQYAPGQQLPGTVYRVVRHLATGGMGSVYDVEDITVGKRYVLKTLHPQLVSRHDLAKRMEAEARTLAKLQHPNIVDVVTAGLTTDEQRMPFYVMERLNGQNLRVVIEKKGSLELTHCYRIAIDVLDALEQAHENAVIHRDVKPDNIFLHRNANGTTTTKLLDFGIMRLLDRKASHTQGKFIGTLRYASPEQIFGGDLGPATDIYSLGIVLYEMLAGRGPFDELSDAFAIGAAHAQRPPPPVSTFANVPPQLERLVMSALAKSPDDRPRDCFSFASELRRMLRHEETAPRSATAVNVLTSAPATRAAGELPHAGTELSPPPTRPTGAIVARAQGLAATEVGMPAHSLIARPSDLPPTVRHGGSGGERPDAMLAETDLAVASTLASEPGSSGSSGGGAGRPPIDRAAETRASGVSGATQRLAQYGTSMEDLGPPMVNDDAVRAALAQPGPLEVPPASDRRDARVGDQEIVFPHAHGRPTGTGPIAGEALTRPPERSMLLPLLAAAAFGAVLVGGAALLVTKPWVKHSAPSTGTTTAAPQAVAGPSSAAPLASAATSVPPAPSAPTASAAVSAAATVAQARPAVTAANPAAAGVAGAAPKKAVARPRPDDGRTPPRPPRPEEVGF